MKAAAVIAVMSGVIAIIGILYFGDAQSNFSEERADSVAANFAAYRNAALKYFFENNVSASSIPSEDLFGPDDDWRSQREWKNEIISSGNYRRLYVYGRVSGIEAESVMKKFLNSYAIGVKRNGFLVPGHGVQMALPSVIPDGNIVSVIEVDK